MKYVIILINNNKYIFIIFIYILFNPLQLAFSNLSVMFQMLNRTLTIMVHTYVSLNLSCKSYVRKSRDEYH